MTGATARPLPASKPRPHTAPASEAVLCSAGRRSMGGDGAEEADAAAVGSAVVEMSEAAISAGDEAASTEAAVAVVEASLCLT